MLFETTEYAPFQSHPSVPSLKYLPNGRKNKSRFFAHHPRTEKRSGPRSLRMTVFVFL